MKGPIEAQIKNLWKTSHEQGLYCIAHDCEKAIAGDESAWSRCVEVLRATNKDEQIEVAKRLLEHDDRDVGDTLQDAWKLAELVLKHR